MAALDAMRGGRVLLDGGYRSTNQTCLSSVPETPMIVTPTLPRSLFAASLTIAGVACRPVSPRAIDAGPPTVETNPGPSEAPRPAVIAAAEGERRLLRGGTAALLIKVDPVTTGSRRMVLGSSELPPGDAIPVHRHLQEDEIILVLHGTAQVQLGAQHYSAAPGGTVYIPEGTCIAVTNAGADTLNIVFVFSSPGFEKVLREVSSREGEPVKVVSPAERAAAFHRGHAVAGPTDC
jgi:quercetin dioxygenase-like cupin family protein